MITQTVVKKERWPDASLLKATPLVSPDQEVLPDQPVLRLDHTNASKKGVVQGVSSSPALPTPEAEMVPAGLHGRVVEITWRGGVIIESQVTRLQGAFGIGNQIAGILTIWQPERVQGKKTPPFIPPGAILVVPGPLDFSLLQQAHLSGVAGIIASSILLRDLEGFLRTDLLALLTADTLAQAYPHLPPLKLMFTEGLGSIPMPTHVLYTLSQYQGSIALLSGHTSLRQRIFPDLLISLPIQETPQNSHPAHTDPQLSLGTPVRICAGERAGAAGVIDYFFTYSQLFPSGIRTRAVRLLLEDGSHVTVPVTLVAKNG